MISGKTLSAVTKIYCLKKKFWLDVVSNALQFCLKIWRIQQKIIIKDFAKFYPEVYFFLFWKIIASPYGSYGVGTLEVPFSPWNRSHYP